MRALVVGYGSIGARHARLLGEAGADVACVTRNAACPVPVHGDVAEAVGDFRPDRVVVANPTARHAGTLEELASAGYDGPVLVEKPLFGGWPPAGSPPRPERVFVAYNLRFHPLLLRLRERLAGRPLYTAAFHAGQHLPAWRPGTDYRAGYSARRAEGGGVLRDLSHEIDLATWLCGGWTRVAALGGQVSDLEIETDDAFSLLLAGERCPMTTISVNYLDRMPRRQVAINAGGLTAVLDLVGGRLVVDGEVVEASVERDATYRAQIAAFMAGDGRTLCTYAEGVATEALIAAAELAASSGRWVARSG